MSAPMVRGCDVARVLQFVYGTLGTRGYRSPVNEMACPEHAHLAALLCVRELDLCMQQLSLVSLALVALENYYRALGATWDARRISDMRWPVDMAIHDHQVKAERERSNRHAEMWQRAFSEAFWSVA